MFELDAYAFRYKHVTMIHTYDFVLPSLLLSWNDSDCKERRHCLHEQ